jgi:integrase
MDAKLHLRKQRTKGEASSRKILVYRTGGLIDLPKLAIEALREHRVRQVKERLALGADWRPELNLVFTSELGTPLNPSNVTRRSFHPLLKRSHLPRIRFHDLRHTAATLLLAAGEHPKVVQERLGHHSVALTLDVYSHVLPSMQKAAAAKIDAILAAASLRP